MSRPSILNFFFKSISALSSAGPKTQQLFERVAGSRVIDLLFHAPRLVRIRHTLETFSDDFVGKYVILHLTVNKHIKPQRRGAPYYVVTSSPAGDTCVLTFFKPYEHYLRKTIQEDHTYFISGVLTKYKDQYQINHPDFIKKNKSDIPEAEAIYPLTSGLTSYKVRQLITQALEEFPPLGEWHSPSLVREYQFPSFKDALYSIHSPQSLEDLSPQSKPRERLAFDEIMATTLTLKLLRKTQHKAAGITVKTKEDVRQSLLQKLPFSLTPSQREVLQDIDQDMASPYKMIRLLQGDVGAGKTIIALLAGFQAMIDGYQVALMAPTEILARQHFEDLQALLIGFGIETVLLVGKDKIKEKRQKLEDIASGKARFIVGTHALFQSDVIYRNLALIVIDEQHRFGVHQRLLLSQKNKGANLLVMTATPIPRTLIMSIYGDLDVSRLTGKPKNRQPITTHIIKSKKMPSLIEGLKRKIKAGEKIFWVCPLVEESDKMDIISAEERYSFLKKYLPESSLFLVHGRMSGEDKDKAMQSFQGERATLPKSKESPSQGSILVATTVIEVGVNIPEATVMIIENPERFGLAALHQLRGRIGRGNLAADCILLIPDDLSQTAFQRLSVLKESTDGFEIAEKDLEIRGGGEILGTKQSGLPQFRFADLKEHKELFFKAHQETDTLLQKNPSLSGKEGEHIKQMLYLFDCDSALLTKQAG